MKLYLLLLLTAFVTACNEPVARKGEEDLKQAVMRADNEEVVKALFEHFNKHEWDKMADLYIDSASFKDPSFGRGIVKQSRRQIIDKYKQLNNYMPDINDRVIHIYPSGEKHIIVEFVSTGTASDGMKIELPICTIFTIENGKITQDFTYYDNEG